ncbi:MAG: EF-hand domain-containing protein [Nitrosomonadales bacterium]|nr:EF-hand domain-containing protein [Nitrosomonadales bacterium]
MTNPVHFLAVVSCCALSATWAHAEPKAHDMRGTLHEQAIDRHFKEMDANDDGTITKAEFDDFHTKHFQDIDSNKDGKLTREEMREGHKEKQEKSMAIRFDEADANHDGALSRDEAEKMPGLSGRFGRTDANKDGKLSREEVENSMKRMRGYRE